MTGQGLNQRQRRSLFARRRSQPPRTTSEAEPALHVESVPEHAEDHWLDATESSDGPAPSPLRRFFQSTFAGSTQIVRRLFGFFTTTPGQMGIAVLVLTVTILAAGLSMANSVTTRQSDLNNLLSATEPISNSAHKLYMSLSLADTIATTGFVQAGVEPSETRTQYAQAVDSAAVEATSAVLDSSQDDTRIQELAVHIQRRLPVYTSLVEAARTNNRAGNAVSVAYMSNASAMMRDDILPAAAELFQLSSENVSNQQHRLTRPQWVPLSGLLAAVFFLTVAQLWLWQVTRRRFNRGFLAATIMMATAMLWVFGSNIYTWQAGSRGFEEASTPWDSLTAARIDVQRARTDEILALVQRQTSYDPSTTFSATINQVSLALDDFTHSSAVNPADSEENYTAVDKARGALRDWDLAKDHLVNALETGNYDEAVTLTTSIDGESHLPTTSASAFVSLDNALAELIADARQSMRSFLNDGLSALNLVAAAVSLLSVLSVLAVWLGIRPRMVEYL